MIRTTALSMMLVAMLASSGLGSPIVVQQPVDDGSPSDANGWFRTDGGTAQDLHQDTSHTPPNSFTASGRNSTNFVEGNEIGATANISSDGSFGNVAYLNFDVPVFDDSIVTEVKLALFVPDYANTAYRVGWTTNGAKTAPELDCVTYGCSINTTDMTIELSGPAAFDPDIGGALMVAGANTPFSYSDPLGDDAGLAEHIVANMGGKVTLLITNFGATTDGSASKAVQIYGTDPCLEDNCSGPSEQWPGDRDPPGNPADPQYAPRLVIIPEPASMALLGLGGLMMLRRRS